MFRSGDRFAYRLGVGGIILLSLHIRLHISRWHEAHGVADRPELARPMMRRRTRFNADEARWQLLKERQDVAALELTANNDIPCCIDAMDLKDRFGDVETDRCRDPLHAWLPSSWPPRRRPAHPTYVEVEEPSTASESDIRQSHQPLPFILCQRHKADQ
jgi:hypothetical protein